MKITPRKTWEEFCAEQEAEQRRQGAAILAYQQQLREQKPGMYISGWKLLKFFAEVVLGFTVGFGICWFIWQVIVALPRFIEAWQ